MRIVHGYAKCSASGIAGIGNTRDCLNDRLLICHSLLIPDTHTYRKNGVVCMIDWDHDGDIDAEDIGLSAMMLDDLCSEDQPALPETQKGLFVVGRLSWNGADWSLLCFWNVI